MHADLAWTTQWALDPRRRGKLTTGAAFQKRASRMKRKEGKRQNAVAGKTGVGGRGSASKTPGIEKRMYYPSAKQQDTHLSAGPSVIFTTVDANKNHLTRAHATFARLNNTGRSIQQQSSHYSFVLPPLPRPPPQPLGAREPLSKEKK